MPTVVVESIKLSGPKRVDFEVYRGDSGMFRLTVNDIDGDPIDISAATWDADIRRRGSDTDTITTMEVVPVVGHTNQVDVILSADKSDLLTKAVAYDVEMRMGDQVVTLVTGVMHITQDVSRP